MQLFNSVRQQVAEFAKDNATTLLTAGGVVGVVGTAIFAGRAGFKLGRLDSEARSRIFQEKYEQDNDHVLRHETDEWIDIEVPKKDLIVGAIPELIPPVIAGSATIGAIIMSNRMSAQKAAALAAAYGLAERNFADYKAKVEEKLTGPKATQVDDELAQEAVDRTPGHEKLVIIDGEVLCLDRSGGRYFRSSMEVLRRAVNTVNHEINNHGFASASFFYKELGLPGTDWSDSVGFDMSNMLELTFSTAMTPDQRPCITFEFKSLPKAEYGPKYMD